MSIVAALLDKARERSSIPSDNALAAFLSVERQSTSKWRTGKGYPSEEHIARLAQMAGDDPGEWLIRISAERSSGVARAAWLRMARQLGIAACLATVVLGALPAHSEAVGTRHYAKW